MAKNLDEIILSKNVQSAINTYYKLQDTIKDLTNQIEILKAIAWHMAQTHGGEFNYHEVSDQQRKLIEDSCFGIKISEDKTVGKIILHSKDMLEENAYTISLTKVEKK